MRSAKMCMRFFAPSFRETHGTSSRFWNAKRIGKANSFRSAGTAGRFASRADGPWRGQNSGFAALADQTGISPRATRKKSALRESEKRYRRFVTEDFTGNLSIRPDGQIVTCNPAFANIFGFDSIEEATSGNFLELLRSRKDGVELLEMVRQNGIVERHELEMSQRGGDPVYVVARLVGIFCGRRTHRPAGLSLQRHQDESGSNSNSSRPKKWRASGPWRAESPTILTTFSRSF